MTFAFGWRKPAAEVYTRLMFSGTPAESLFAGVEPADSADCSDLVQILDQGPIGSCSANAIAQMLRAAMLFDGAPITTDFPARLWLYTLALATEGQLGRDVGTHNATVMDEAAKYGFPKESHWPYDPATFGQKPSVECDRSAYDQREQVRVAFHQITETGSARLTVIRQANTAGKLVVFGTAVDPDEICNYNPGTVLDVPKPGKATAGHAMCVCGYEPDPETGLWIFKIANSWGTGYGDKGFLWMTAKYMAWDETADLWVVSKVPRFSEDAT